MKFKTFILVFVVVANTNIYSQNTTTSYNHILHPSILENESLFNSSVDVILREAELTPELIYYRINFLNEIYGNQNRIQESNGFLELKDAKSKYILERNSWVQSQINHVDKNYSTNKYHSAIRSFYEDLLLQTLRTKPTLTKKVDQNKMDFYTLFYYSKGEINKYDKRKNYNLLRKEYEASLINEIEQIDVANKALEESKEEVYDLIENNIFLISNSSNKLNYSEILLSQMKNDYSTKHINSASLGVFYAAPFAEGKLEMGFGEGIYDSEGNPIGSIELQNLIGIELGYKIFIKQELEYFSYIRLNLFYLKSNTSFDINAEPGLYRKTIEDSKEVKIYEFYDIKQSEFGKINNDLFALGLATPIIVINPQATIDIGVSISYQNLGFELLDASYDYWKVKSTYIRDGVYDYEYLEKKDDVNEKNQFDDISINISPFVTLNWSVYDFIDIRVSTNINFASIGVNATF